MQSLKKYLFVLVLLSFGTYFTFADTPQGINYILVGCMCLFTMSAVLFKRYDSKIERHILFVLLLILIASLRHRESLRWSSYIYSVMFVMSFVAYTRILSDGHAFIGLYRKILVFLIVVFFVVLLLQQCCYLMGFDIINYRAGDSESVKFNSLASESSYFGRIIFLLFFSYTLILGRERGHRYNLKQDFFKDIRLWGVVVYCLLTSGSSFSFLMLLLLLVRTSGSLLDLKKVFYFTAMIIACMLLVNNQVFSRITNLLTAMTTFDPESMLSADTSGAFRIVPSIIYLGCVDFTSVDFLLGAGLDHTALVMPDYVSALSDLKFAVGLFPAFIWDFGFVATAVLLYFAKKYLFSNLFDVLIWIVIVLDAPFNTQLFWLAAMLMYTNKILIENSRPCPVLEKRQERAGDWVRDCLLTTQMGSK